MANHKTLTPGTPLKVPNLLYPHFRDISNHLRKIVNKKEPIDTTTVKIKIPKYLLVPISLLIKAYEPITNGYVSTNQNNES